ncbi:hypothetical protein SLOPH_1811 [Spraguea lophii 42_110]|uniref:Uncharacterized protein n=1 Tax=Spraguea lophii (strain 42_110) TaxID=1358809 RepID=S7XRA8_SPRLO|nr:hypothetical protein SLOPH_1811 [Spraguea lophii 42_110]
MENQSVFFIQGMSPEAEYKLIHQEQERKSEITLQKSEKAFGNKLFTGNLFVATDFKLHNRFNILNCILNIQPFYNFIENMCVKYKKKMHEYKLLRYFYNIVALNNMDSNYRAIEEFCGKDKNCNLDSVFKKIIGELNDEITSFLFFEKKVWMQVNENIKTVDKKIFEYSPLVEIFHCCVEKEDRDREHNKIIVNEDMDVIELKCDDSAKSITSLFKKTLERIHDNYKIIRFPLAFVFNVKGKINLDENLRIQKEDYELRSFIYGNNDLFIKVDKIWMNVENGVIKRKNPDLKDIEPSMVFYVKKQ